MHVCVHVCVSVRDRDRHLAQTDSFFSCQAFNFIQQKLPEGTRYHHVDITVISYGGPYESTPVGAALVSAHQTASKTVKMRIFCQPAGTLLLNLAAEAETVLGYSCGHCGPGSGSLSARRSVPPCFPLQSL